MHDRTRQRAGATFESPYRPSTSALDFSMLKLCERIVWIEPTKESLAEEACSTLGGSGSFSPSTGPWITPLPHASTGCARLATRNDGKPLRSLLLARKSILSASTAIARPHQGELEVPRQRWHLLRQLYGKTEHHLRTKMLRLRYVCLDSDSGQPPESIAQCPKTQSAHPTSVILLLPVVVHRDHQPPLVFSVCYQVVPPPGLPYKSMVITVQPSDKRHRRGPSGSRLREPQNISTAGLLLPGIRPRAPQRVHHEGRQHPPAESLHQI